MKIRMLLLLSAAGFVAGWGLSAAPVVSNVRAAQRAGTYLVDIYYNLSSAVSPLSVLVAVSADGGANYNVPAFTFSGAVGAGVTPGTDLHILWNAGTDWGSQFTTACRVRVTADDGTAPPTPSGMVYIPAGAFWMGDNVGGGEGDEIPVHNVGVSAFFMDRFEVSREMWLDVQTWATSHGYAFDGNESWWDSGHPVTRVSWYDAIKWCNARSEKEGLVPCFYTSTSQTAVYRTAQLDLSNAQVKWNASGYRLPKEAEWEKAARGGLQGKRYPWGNAIDGSNANYLGSGDPFTTMIYPYEGTTPIGYYNGRQVPVGVDMANGYGLYDMCGNVWEWCWDWYDQVFYGRNEAKNDPHGPALGMYRVCRGGSFDDEVTALRCANRGAGNAANSGWVGNLDIGENGFRCVRGL